MPPDRPSSTPPIDPMPELGQLDPIKYCSSEKEKASLTPDRMPIPSQVIEQAMIRILLAASFALLLSATSGQTGANDPTFDPGTVTTGYVKAMAIQPDGKIVIAQSIVASSGQLARLNSDGGLDTDFDPGTGPNFQILVMALQPDGKILIGGDLTSYNGTPRNCIARVNGDGSVDLDFDPGMGTDDYVSGIVLQPDGKILICGNFSNCDGTARNKIARLNTDGSLDLDFDPGAGANDFIYCMALQPDGKVMVGGKFTSYDGTARSSVARLNADGSLDATFDPGTGATGSPLGTVYSMALRTSGKLLIGGWFTTFDGTARNKIAQVNPDGSLDPGFDPGTGFDDVVYSITLPSEDKALAGGFFTHFNGTSQHSIVRLDNDGSRDETFDSGSGANGYVASMATQADGDLLIGGAFTIYDGAPRQYIARIIVDDISGIHVDEPLDAIRIAPNPVVHTLHLTGPLEPCKWLIIDTQGRSLRSGQSDRTQDLSIPVSSLASGNYVLSLQFGERQRSIQFSTWDH